MRQRHKPAAATKPDIRTLEMLLDYAMMEGAALRLPLFVLLLRTAQLELMTRAGSGGGLHGRRHKTKIGESLGAVECLSFAERVAARRIEADGDTLHGPQLVIQDR